MQFIKHSPHQKMFEIKLAHFNVIYIVRHITPFYDKPLQDRKTRQ